MCLCLTLDHCGNLAQWARAIAVVCNLFRPLNCCNPFFFLPFPALTQPLCQGGEAVDLDALAAAIEGPASQHSDVDHLLPVESRVQRNPFIDAAVYVRAGNIERGPRSAGPTKQQVKRQQLRK